MYTKPLYKNINLDSIDLSTINSFIHNVLFHFHNNLELYLSSFFIWLAANECSSVILHAYIFVIHAYIEFILLHFNKEISNDYHSKSRFHFSFFNLVTQSEISRSARSELEVRLFYFSTSSQ